MLQHAEQNDQGNRRYMPIISFKDQVSQWCFINGVQMKYLTEYQHRLIKDKITCDIYWVNKRYHIIKHTVAKKIQNRGTIKNVKTFLDATFN